MDVDKFTVEYINVASERYGKYTLLKLKDVTPKEVRDRAVLADALKENFGERFVIVHYAADGNREYVLNEYIIGVPTPEFERQLQAGEWKVKKIAAKQG